MKKSFLVLAVGFLLAALPQARAAEAPLVFGIPGIPPVFLAVQEYVAQEQGFWKKYGIDVTLRQFDTGIAAMRAVASGDIDITIGPTGAAANILSNAGVPLLGIYGLEHSDFMIGSTDAAIKSCHDLPGHPIGVDVAGGARSVALRQMVADCGYPFSRLQEVGLGAHTAETMIAGQIQVGVLHLDDLAVVQAKLGHPITVVMTHRQVRPVSHYDLFVVRAERVKAQRDRFVRLIAGLIDAASFLHDPKNLDRAAQIATVTGHSPAEAKAAIQQYIAIDFWPQGNAGLDRKDVEAEIQTQASLGGIKPGGTPVTYDKLVDPSLWPDALALTKK